MKSWTQAGVAIAAATLLWSGTAALAQTTAPSQGAQPRPSQGAQPRTPEMVQGEVVKIDRNTGRVSVRGSDGSIHEFQATKETLQDLKEGDRIQARLRQR